MTHDLLTLAARAHVEDMDRSAKANLPIDLIANMRAALLALADNWSSDDGLMETLADSFEMAINHGKSPWSAFVDTFYLFFREIAGQS